MDLKSMVLEALSDIEQKEVSSKDKIEAGRKLLSEIYQEKQLHPQKNKTSESEETVKNVEPLKPQVVKTEAKIDTNEKKIVIEQSKELEFLESIKERLLVVFEGFHSPNNQAVEAKIDLTINLLEYLLSKIEERIKLLK